MTRDERFWQKVDTSGDCWLWTGYVMPNGYGQFRWPGGSLAHRYAYETTNGPIPDGLDLDHLCRTRNCVRPDHLDPVPRVVNLLRGARKTAQTTCKNGHPLAGDNLKPRSRQRQCRACANEANRRYLLRRRIGAGGTTPITTEETRLA